MTIEELTYLIGRPAISNSSKPSSGTNGTGACDAPNFAHTYDWLTAE
jgi:hypothetical protein